MQHKGTFNCSNTKTFLESFKLNWLWCKFAWELAEISFGEIIQLRCYRTKKLINNQPTLFLMIIGKLINSWFSCNNQRTFSIVIERRLWRQRKLKKLQRVIFSVSPSVELLSSPFSSMFFSLLLEGTIIICNFIIHAHSNQLSKFITRKIRLTRYQGSDSTSLLLF